MANDVETLKQACAGLLYPSESDEPLRVHELESQGTAEEALEAYGAQGLAEVPFDEFFHDFQESDPANLRITELKEKLQSLLYDLRVFRCGEVEVSVFILGQSGASRWICLETLSVET